MNVTSSTSPPAVPAASGPDEIDASCRVPVLVLFSSGAVWLIVASVFGLMASIKFHSPDFLSDSAWLTYGRVYAVAKNAMLYGFAIQAGLGVSLWILARTSNVVAIQPWLIAIGGKLWNLGVFVGAIGILVGDSTGFENLEMPRYAAILLFLAFVFMGLWMLFVVGLRRVRTLEPSQWFLIAALFWFPWIFSTAYLLLTVWPVRGVTQSIISWWFSSNLKLVWLGLVGLAVAFHFIPLLMKRRLHSQYVALFTFWTLILFASWSGIPAGAPVPAWIPALSTVATVLTSVTVLSVMVNVCRTCGGGCSETENPPPGKFLAFAVMAFAVSWAMNIIAAVPGLSVFAQFTWFTVAQSELNVYGFFAMALFGAIYCILPRATGWEWPWPKLIRLHFWLAAGGIVLIVLPLAIGGLIQGYKLNHPPMAFVDLSKTTLHFLRISTVGELMILAGHLVFAANVLGLLAGYLRHLFTPVYRSAMTELPVAEVKP